MSLYWRKQDKLPDTELPQVIMRPFWHPEPKSLDDRQFHVQLPDERPLVIATISLLILRARSVAVKTQSNLLLTNVRHENEFLPSRASVSGTVRQDGECNSGRRCPHRLSNSNGWPD